ncbi:sigma 54-interacting transcriptional regulator [Singulisphaera sp. PoT]|uniref:sigma 54-interacting transcriptional regulator n=1 Tax=Singulisphaera sp. PoT TaxID=3411797 RepID=UPI003BF5DA6A
MASPRLSGARLDGFWQQVSEPSFWLSPEFRLIWVNKAWEELTGYSFEAVAGLACHAHGPNRGGDIEGLGGSFYPPQEVRTGRSSSVRTLIVHNSGERRWRRIDFWPFHDDAGELLGILGLVSLHDAQGHLPEPPSHRLRADLLEVRDKALGRFGFDTLIGKGPSHRRLLEQVLIAATTSSPVLILGESGTGKRMIARTIHQQGDRRQAPILPFDCAALPAEVLERGLFDEEGSGRAQINEGGTLLIGDILELPRDLQRRLAESIESGELRLRLLATTIGDPDVALQEERLCAELYYSLTTMVIRLKPLRERLEELPVLAQHLLERANGREKLQRSGFSESALGVLMGYDWPGNLRELARVIDEAHEAASGDLIEADDLPAEIRGHLASAYLPPPLAPETSQLDELLTQVERRLIESSLQRARHNKSRAAEQLGISRPRLYRRIKELGLPDEPEPSDDGPANGARP